MATNIFLAAPPKCIIVNPLKPDEIIHTYVFLGNVPSTISKAANEFPSGNNKLLREWYGPDYIDKLGLTKKSNKISSVRTSQRVSDGLSLANDDSASKDGGDDDLDAINEMLEQAKNSRRPDDKQQEKNFRGIKSQTFNAEIGGLTFAPQHVYPEDKMTDLKDKLFLASGIPPHRQHLYYKLRDVISSPYRIQIDGVYPADITHNESHFQILGFPVDRFMCDFKNDIVILAQDGFITLESIMEHGQTVIYCADIAMAIKPAYSQIMDLYRTDKYQFDMFYHGYILKFWPQLTYQAFSDELTSPADMSYKYPDLAKSQIVVASATAIEQNIIDDNYAKAQQIESLMESNAVDTAITAITAFVLNPQVLLNIRNIFDAFATSRDIPEIHARVKQGPNKYLLRKVHETAGEITPPAGPITKIAIMFCISMGKQESLREQFLYLILQPSGKCYIKATWPEDAGLGFDDIIKITKKFTDPIISAINRMGRIAFIQGQQLQPLTKQNVIYQGLNVCIMWRRLMLEQAFKEVKSQWDYYVRAGIIIPRQAQSANRYEFMFCKGIYEFDTSMIESIVSKAFGVKLSNRYMYLSDAGIKQKWDQHFKGRVVSMTHRTSDIKFEIADVHESEFKTFARFIGGFILRIKSNVSIVKLMGTPSTKSVKKVKKLREQDPKLFDHKNYDNTKTYSVMCQQGRQPVIYSAEEIKLMQQHAVSKLTKYWNMTLDRPAWYGCHNKKYPHMSFIVGKHPLGYCLPCCSKQNGRDTLRSKINVSCLRDHTYTSASGTTSKHIVAYGKSVDIGRMSKVHSDIHTLLRDALEPNTQLYIYGCGQHLPNISNIGIFFALAEALNIPSQQLMTKILAYLRGKYFNIDILGIAAELFADGSAIADALQSHMKRQQYMVWSELISTVVSTMFGLRVYMFIDDGSGNCELYASGMTRADIDSMSDSRCVLLCKNRNEVYPIFAIDINKYHQSMIIESRTFDHQSEVVARLDRAIIFVANGDRLPELTLGAIKTHLVRWHVVDQFCGKKNECVAVKLVRRQNSDETKSVANINAKKKSPNDAKAETFDGQKNDADETENFVILPIAHSPSKSCKREVSKYDSPPDLAYELLNDIKAFVDAPIKVVILDGIPRGFLYKYGIIWCSNMDEFLMKNNLNLPMHLIKYDYRDVAEAVLNSEAPSVDPTKNYEYSLYQNYQYQLFVAEFMHFLDEERNDPMRQKLHDIIMNTDITKDVKKVKKAIADLHNCKDNCLSSADYSQLLSGVSDVYDNKWTAQKFIENINASVFDFDRITLTRLRDMNPKDLKSALVDICVKFAVDKVPDPDGFKFPNMFAAGCSTIREGVAPLEKNSHCSEGKLIVQNLDKHIEILATDLGSDIRVKVDMLNIWYDTCTDNFDFISRNGELIEIYKL